MFAIVLWSYTCVFANVSLMTSKWTNQTTLVACIGVLLFTF